MTNKITFRPYFLANHFLVIGTCSITGREVSEPVEASLDHLRALRVSIDPDCLHFDFCVIASDRALRARKIRRRRSMLRELRREMGDVIDRGFACFNLALRIANFRVR